MRTSVRPRFRWSWQRDWRLTRRVHVEKRYESSQYEWRTYGMTEVIRYCWIRLGPLWFERVTAKWKKGDHLHD